MTSISEERRRRVQLWRKRGFTLSKIAKKLGVTLSQVVHASRDLTPVDELKILTLRKKKALGLPTGRNAIPKGGRDHSRELVRMRDKHTCQICKKKWRKGQRRFDIHHKDEDPKKTRIIDKPEDFDNLVTLCHKCHLRLHYDCIAIKDIPWL